VTITNFTWRQGTRSVRLAMATGLVAAALGLSACGSDYVRNGQASSYLIINRLIMSEGSSSGAPFQSDVMSDSGSIFEDGAVVRLSAEMKDINSPTSPNNFITVTRYRVTFRRSDGRNTPGVDVPYAFDGAASATVEVGDEVTVPFVIVRIQAKLEQPLASLRGHGGAGAISTIADVTFFGHDQTGREVSVTGSTSVNFADWAG
jgi:hypothetical protein